jgi:hypothetical protein
MLTDVLVPVSVRIVRMIVVSADFKIVGVVPVFTVFAALVSGTTGMMSPQSSMLRKSVLPLRPRM